MARQLRLEYPGALYHLTARGNEQQSIFHDDTDRQHFLTLLGREILQQRWRCYAYCLMEDKKGSGVFSHDPFGQPQGRNIDSILNRFTKRCTQASSPNRRPR